MREVYRMWNLNFISRDDFKNHVANTIKTYDETLKAIDLKTFNNNIVDPIKLTFDSRVYRKNIEDVINNEIIRQRDKTNTNAIGYFHQNMFKYIKNCEVPNVGFDVIFSRPNGTKVYVEMKNKHNTMNAASSQKTYIKMQGKILEDDKALCMLVEIIAKRSQDIKWSITVDKNPRSHKQIRRVSIDKFYEIVFNDKNAFFKLCKALPDILDDVISADESAKLKNTVYDELDKTDFYKSLYLLAFKTYEGFDNF